jgi:hypothetical protein
VLMFQQVRFFTSFFSSNWIDCLNCNSFDFIQVFELPFSFEILFESAGDDARGVIDSRSPGSCLRVLTFSSWIVLAQLTFFIRFALWILARFASLFAKRYCWSDFFWYVLNLLPILSDLISCWSFRYFLFTDPVYGYSSALHNAAFRAERTAALTASFKQRFDRFLHEGQKTSETDKHGLLQFALSNMMGSNGYFFGRQQLQAPEYEWHIFNFFNLSDFFWILMFIFSDVFSFSHWRVWLVPARRSRSDLWTSFRRFSRNGAMKQNAHLPRPQQVSNLIEFHFFTLNWIQQSVICFTVASSNRSWTCRRRLWILSAVLVVLLGAVALLLPARFFVGRRFSSACDSAIRAFEVVW